VDVRLKAQRWRRRRGQRRRRRFLLAIILIIALSIAILVGVVLFRPHSRAGVRPQPSPAAHHYRKTAWLQAGKPWTPQETARFALDMGAIANSTAFPQSTGMLIVDGRDGSVLYSRNARASLIPGSTIKLVTAAAALDALGPDHRFTTSMASNGAQDGGVLNGSIWLVGGGDPELTSDDLRRGVHQLQLGGVDRITGDVYADGSRYGSDQVSADWEPDDLQYGWAAPASALSIDGGSVQFTITPRAGTQADVAVDPPGHRVIASVDTVSSSGDNTLRIDVLPGDGGYEVRGQIPYGAPQKYWRAVPHPTRAAAVSLLAMLRLAGVDVDGSAQVGQAPAQAAVLWQHTSRPLALIIKQMFLLSDNHYAEELLRAVGWQATGDGDLHNSLAAERSFMTSNGILTDGVVLADGSGLSAKNRLTAQSLAATLRFLLNEPMPHPPFSLLPRAGVEGTVSVRHLAPGVKGRVYAKDGYIEGASAIAGYVLTAHHGPVIFAFIVNDWQHGLDAVWADEDQMLDRIASW
jgi:serine-type D-Ala-D-Ala carboxypeptidase/endopeptidase (penicillin-binding protein 4)